MGTLEKTDINLSHIKPYSSLAYALGFHDKEIENRRRECKKTMEDESKRYEENELIAWAEEQEKKHQYESFYSLARKYIGSEYNQFTYEKVRALHTFRRFREDGKQPIKELRSGVYNCTPIDIGRIFTKIVGQSNKTLKNH